MTKLKQAQLELLLTISEGLSRGSYEMLQVSPTDAMHAPSCGLAIRDAVEELKWMRAAIKRQRAEIKNLRANNKRMRELLSAIQIDTNADGSVWLTLSPSAYPGFIAVVYLGSQKLMAGTAALLFDELRRNALEALP